MDILPTIFPWMGVALCGMVLFQMALWSAHSISLFSQNKKQLELSRQQLRNQIEAKLDAQASDNHAPFESVGWSGFRPFRVARLVKETDRCTSVYLKPEDGKRLAGFLPGQYLTCKFYLRGEPKPLTRCYSLSDTPNHNDYRITVKSVPAPQHSPELPPGRVSNHINQSLTVGDRVELKSPSGHFFLDDRVRDPIILLAGGIGISPLMAMAKHLTTHDTNQLVLLVYGLTHSADHAFKQALEQLALAHQNFHVLNCYSRPLPDDVQGRDYHVHGYAAVDRLKTILPNNQCQFYLCGPSAFMESLHGDLIQWGVPESRINYEAFGPATIKKTTAPTEAPGTNQASACSIKFSKSDVSVAFTPSNETLLELAESNDIAIDSGCRTGNCGTCATRLLKGKIRYANPDDIDCEDDECLVCIAEPLGDIELDA